MLYSYIEMQKNTVKQVMSKAKQILSESENLILKMVYA